jgi:hypothetical protein
MPKPITENQLADFWLSEYSRTGHCCLCANHGIIDTRGKVRTPAGVECGDRVWCVCPNGRAMKRGSGLSYPPDK